MSVNRPIRGVAYVFDVALVDLQNPSLFKSSPTLAAGDWKVSKDDGALANLGTLPSVSPASSKNVKVSLSSTEMTADRVVVIGSDAAGAEWADIEITIYPEVAVDIESSVSDASPAVGDFDAASGLSATDDFYNGSVLVFTNGTLKGIARKITDYTGSSRNLVFATAFPTAPANGDAFEILGRID